VHGCKRPEAAAARGRRLAVSHWLRAAELEEYQIVAQRLFRLKMFKKIGTVAFYLYLIIIVRL
jgi:hypothetical protein